MRRARSLDYETVLFTFHVSCLTVSAHSWQRCPISVRSLSRSSATISGARTWKIPHYSWLPAIRFETPIVRPRPPRCNLLSILRATDDARRWHIRQEPQPSSRSIALVDTCTVRRQFADAAAAASMEKVRTPRVSLAKVRRAKSVPNFESSRHGHLSRPIRRQRGTLRLFVFQRSTLSPYRISQRKSADARKQVWHEHRAHDA